MPRSAPPRASSALALATADDGGGAIATPARLSGAVMGEAGSRDALARLTTALADLKAASVAPTLQAAVNALNANDHKAGSDLALQALQTDERNGFAWYLLAIAREKAGDFATSITCYESALALLPNHAEVANDLGRLAFRLGMKPQAEKLFRHFLERFPNHHEGANNLACAVRDQGRFDEAIEILKSAMLVRPDVAMLWNTMGTIVGEQGDFQTASIFFDETLRLDPGFSKARYNRGNARLSLGDAPGALEDCEAALATPMPEFERQMMLLARSTIKIALGRIGDGWDDYEARLHPQFSDVTRFAVDRPQWKPGDDLSGKSLLVIGEQGLGDEILFANILPDLDAAVGPAGRLVLAVEPRLAPLFQRSFPRATVGSHLTVKVEGKTVRLIPFLKDGPEIDLWTPMASPLRAFRRSAEAFPDRASFLAADPERVAHWRRVLEDAPAGKKVGLLWKSAVSSSGRHRYFSPFDQWAPILAVPGVSFINLQYGDCSAEIEQARRDLGVEIWTPPGIDLKQDLDDVAALSCALDLVLGFSNATLNIAAACGAPCWLISTPAAWTRLGTTRYPWYPQVRLFAPDRYGEWDQVMGAIAGALEHLD